MRFSLPDSYFEFFLKHRILEVENLLSSQEAETLCTKTEALLLRNLHQNSLNLASNEELWKAGKNHWKDDPEIKTILFRLQFGEISKLLFKTRPIRLAYTQAFFTENQQDPLFSAPKILQEISCVTPLLGGALICSRDSTTQEKTAPLIPDLKTTKIGRIFFFSKEFLLPFSELSKQKGIRMILVAFAPGKIRYKLESKDLHTHDLKKLGYGFGDLIKEDLCPYLCR